MAEFYRKFDLLKQETRLITLLPGKFEDVISCALFVVPLTDPPVYEALSYVWGDPAVTLSILLNELEFQITVNLESALRYLRYHDRDRTIWIDAICINQGDIKERNAQVLQMGDIYRKAQEVIVWLGPTNEQLNRAINLILELGQASHLYSMPEYQVCKHNRYASDHGEEKFGHLLEFIKFTWFDRLWIIQEIALARTARLQCGVRQIDWEDFSRFISWLQRHRSCCMNYILSSDSWTFTLCRLKTANIYMIQNYLAVHGPTLDLSLVSDMLRQQHCTDNRDRVYGFLALIDNSGIRVDYDISVPELYRQSALTLIAHTGTLDVLNKVGFPKNYHTLPSWVPDWSAHTHFERTDFGYRSTPALNRAHFSACGDSRAQVADLRKHVYNGVWREGSFFKDGLLLKGLHVDTVWKTLPVSEWISTGGNTGNRLIMSDKQLLLWEKMIRLDDDPNRCYPGGGTMTNAYWRTLQADTIFDESSGLARRLQPEDFDDYLQFRKRMDNIKRPQSSDSTSAGTQIPDSKTPVGSIKNFGADILHALGDRHLFMTTKGYIGAASKEIYAGDFVCVLFGGSQPFVLRRGQTCVRESGGEPYTWFSLLGPAYVCGIMDGEAMTDVNESNTLDFILR